LKIRKYSNVADSECLFRIRVFSIPGSGSETLEIFFDLSAAVLFILSYQLILFVFYVQAPNNVVAIKAITKKNLAKSQNLLGKEIKILKVST
jgi:hypothetical protein